MRVLVVEDERKTASFVRAALPSEGFAVDVCQRGDEALIAASTVPFDGNCNNRISATSRWAHVTTVNIGIGVTMAGTR